MDKIYNKDYIKHISDVELKVLLDDIDQFYNTDTQNPIKNTDKCPSCGTENRIRQDYGGGFTVCENCGQVLDNVIDESPEWRGFDDDTNSRCSMPSSKLLPQTSLGTNITGGAFKSRIKVLHSWNAVPYKERSLNTVFREIQDKCNKAKIIKCIEDDAKIMYKIINDSKHTSGKNRGKYIIIRGGNRKSLIAACIFFACKKKDMIRSPKEIAEMFKLRQTELSKGCKTFMRLIKRKIELDMKVSMPEHFATRFCNTLHIQQIYIDDVLEIARNIHKLNIATEHTPLSIAIASILMMAERQGLTTITKKLLADKFDISEVTISKTCKKLWQYRDIITNNDVMEKIIRDYDNKISNMEIPQNVMDRMKKFGVQPVTHKKYIIPNNVPLCKLKKYEQCVEKIITVDDYSYYEKKLAEIKSRMDTMRLKYKNLCFMFYDEEIN